MYLAACDPMTLFRRHTSLKAASIVTELTFHYDHGLVYKGRVFMRPLLFTLSTFE